MSTSVRIKPAMENMKMLRLHEKQMEVSRDKHRFRVVVAGRRFGKTFLSAIELIKFAIKRKDSLVWYIAPTYSMARDIMWSTLLSIIPESYIQKKNETKLTIKLKNGSEIQLKGCDKPDMLRGRGVHFVVLDEYQDFRPTTWAEVIFPTLTDTQGYALIIGTPKLFNHLYDAYIYGQDDSFPDWKSWQFPTESSPFIPRKEIEIAKRNLDEKTFRQEYEACHLEDTEILLWDNQSKKIIDCVPGDVAVHVDENGIQYPALVQDVGFTGHKQCSTVTLETGEKFTATTNHKIKVYEDET